MKKTILALTCAALCAAPIFAEEAKKPYRSTDDIIASAPADAWRSVAPENLLYMQLDKGTVIYELAPDFAPEHVAQIRMLARKHFWDGLSIYRVQDNYVTQSVLGRSLNDFILVDDEDIQRAVGLMSTHAHTLAEGAGAASLAGLMADPARRGPCAVVCTGGNADDGELAAIADFADSAVTDMALTC